MLSSLEMPAAKLPALGLSRALQTGCLSSCGHDVRGKGLGGPPFQRGSSYWS